ncbi:MAG: Sua5/YciO/YrdC/YwlC family protein [Phycisphaerales bacterium JB064]
MSPNTSSTRIDAAKDAAAALDKGELAVLRTETVYGVFARGDSREAVDKIRALPRRSGTGSWGSLTWHAPSVEGVLEAHEKASIEVAPALRRAMRRVWPGPVTLRLHGEGLDDLIGALGLLPGVADSKGEDGHALLVRVPDDTWTAMALQRAGGPVVGASAEPIETGEGGPTPGTCPRGLEKAGVSVVLDEGPTRYAKHSTVLDMGSDGDWSVRSEGALTAEQVTERLATLIVFVCTGNTCRSPMAQAIATSLLERRGNAHRAIAVSAGVAAMSGARATPEAILASEAVGASLDIHRSQPAGQDLLDRADVIYAMTASHAEAAKAMLPAGQKSKVHLLDAAGDVEDPIGGPQTLYDELARRFVGIIERRLEELGL